MCVFTRFIRWREKALLMFIEKASVLWVFCFSFGNLSSTLPSCSPYSLPCYLLFLPLFSPCPSPWYSISSPSGGIVVYRSILFRWCRGYFLMEIPHAKWKFLMAHTSKHIVLLFEVSEPSQREEGKGRTLLLKGSIDYNKTVSLVSFYSITSDLVKIYRWNK